MIAVDSSALIAVLFEEAEQQAFQDIIDGEARCVLSAVNARETALGSALFLGVALNARHQLDEAMPQPLHRVHDPVDFGMVAWPQVGLGGNRHGRARRLRSHRGKRRCGGRASVTRGAISRRLG